MSSVPYTPNISFRDVAGLQGFMFLGTGLGSTRGCSDTGF